MYSIRKISIGTANFNKNYGAISNNKVFTLSKINKILKESKKLKIDTIDTSYDYESAEKKLGNFNLKNWKVITKLPKLNLNNPIEDKTNESDGTKIIFIPDKDEGIDPVLIIIFFAL